MESSLSTEAVSDRVRRIARTAFFGILGLVGPVAAIVPNGMAVLFILLGLATVIGDPAARRLNGVPKSVALPLVGLLVWAYVTAFWALDPGLAVFSLTRLVFAIYAGLAVISRARALEPAEIEQAERYFLAGYAVGLALMCAEIASQLAFGIDGSLYVQIFGPKAALESFLNRSKTIFSILLPIALSVAWRRHGIVATAATIAACHFAFAFGESLASAVGLIVAAGAAVMTIALGGRYAHRFVAVGIVGLIVFAPLIARLPALEELSQRPGFKASIFHRAVIWRFVSDRVFERPVFGWGMEASRDIPNAHDTIRPYTEYLPLHPHNAPLQFWLELGGIGALLAAGLAAALALRSGGSLSRRLTVMPTFLTAAFVACVSYGLWQGWWYSSLWIVGALATIVGRGADGRAHHIG